MTTAAVACKYCKPDGPCPLHDVKTVRRHPDTVHVVWKDGKRYVYTHDDVSDPISYLVEQNKSMMKLLIEMERDLRALRTVSGL